MNKFLDYNSSSAIYVKTYLLKGTNMINFSKTSSSIFLMTVLLVGCSTNSIEKAPTFTGKLGFDLVSNVSKTCQSKFGSKTPEEINAVKECILRDTDAMIEYLNSKNSMSNI